MPIQEILPPKHPYERHLAAVLLVDRSGSMIGDPIRELNDGLKLFGKALSSDTLAQGRVDVTVISFGSDVKTEMGFRSAEEYEAPTLSANGSTAFNEAINAGLDALEARKAEFKRLGTNYYRPWLFVLTDGYPTDGNLEESTKNRLKEYIRNKKVTYLPMGIGEANTSHLQSYYPDEAPQKPVLKATVENFKDAFQWLSNSMVETAKSDPKLGTVESAPVPATITLGL